MRPTKLTMTAFGPFGGTEELDLSMLGETGIYLITGPTGSGKTSIFDAICFALFGKLSSKSRDATLFQSDHRKDNLETCVELEFEIRGASYTIIRRFKRRKERATGDYVFDSKQAVELIWPDGSALSGPSQVDPQVEELIGLDFDQFTKIVMLSQGEFKRFLEASSMDRSRIFANIFDTSPYRRIMEGLKALHDDLAAQMTRQGQLTMSDLDGVEVPEDDDGSRFFHEERERGILGAPEALAKLACLIDADKARDDELGERLEQVNDDIQRVSRQRGEAQAIERASAQIERSKNALEQGERALPALEAALADQEGLAPERARIAAERAVLESRFSSYDELGRERSRLDDAQRDLGRAKRAQEDARAKWERVQSDLAGIQETIDVSSDVEVDLEKVRAAIDRHRGRQAEVRDALAACSGYAIELEKLRSAQEASERATKVLDAASAWSSRLEKAYLDAQAGILARGLADGQPCPVCGSSDHPDKARLSDDAPTADQLDAARSDEDAARSRAYELAKRAAAQLEATRNALSRVLQAQVGLLGECRDPIAAESLLGHRECELVEERFESLRRSIDAELASCQDRAGVLDSSRRARHEALERHGELKERSVELKAAEEQAAKDIAASSSAVDHLRSSVESMEKVLPYPTADEARRAVDRLAQRMDDMDRALEEARRRRDECRTRIFEAKVSIEENQEILKGKKAVSPAELDELLARLQGERSEISQGKQFVSNRLSRNEKIHEAATRHLADYQELEERVLVAASLANTALGSVRGTERIQLETYVQAVFFDQMLEYANQRLLGMSGGRYLLVRHAGETRGGAHGGLDLDVLDNDTGQLRSSTTLSGGESFIASLSLALGLSDVTQGHAGGIDLECMFIDEGFGSLDDDALDLALRMLAQIGAEDKLVGIISHVEELKRVIPRKIVVEKSRSGSHASLQLG